MLKRVSIFLIFIIGLTIVMANFYKDAGLHVAAHFGQYDQVMELLKDPNINVDERDKFGGTVLNAAIWQDDIRIIKALVDYGFDINARGTETGYTPLHDAVKAENKEALIYLLEIGADPHIKDNQNMDAMEFAREEEATKYMAILEPYYNAK
ncbi:ankyrin repeat domain-containing protein [Terasakiella sp.]|uniref:ankyrin repeat domain-containing protein n=1 Tax=Terasakiella sp. TaxID=2034861 RepID=UPI003AA7DA7C